MLPTIPSGNVTSGLATGYDVANSCRFNDGDTAYMHKTFASGGTETAWTISMWVKRGALGSDQRVFSCDDSSDGDPDNYWRFKSDDTLQVNIYNGSAIGNLVTNRVFRDVSAWYHVCVIWKSGDSTSTDRLQLWVNGTRETSFSATTFPSQDAATVTSSQVVAIGRRNYGPQQYFDGYLAEVVFLDGITASPVGTLGEFDEDSPTIFKPKDPSGLTFGTNGFYLDFEDSANLGNDANGGTDLTEVNLAATDQATDTPTNNFCTMNPLANYFPASTFSEGNCKIVTASSPYTYNIGTFGLTSGKWYWEIKYVAADGDPHNVGHFGISGKGDPIANSHPLGYYSTDYGIVADSGGTIYNNNSGTTNSLYNIAIGNVLGFGLDLDSGTYTLKFLVNGVDKIDTNISSSPESGAYFPAFGFTYSVGTGTFEANFGGCSAFTVSSANQDANGYGNFEYAVPSGYLALCTKNLGSDGG